MKRKILPLALFLALASPLFSQESSGLGEIAREFLNLPEETRTTYQEHRLKAEQYFRQKRTFECLDEVHKGLKVFDRDPALWNLQGSCYVEFRSFEKAKKAFKKALMLDGNNLGVLFNLAEMDFVTKSWSDATKSFGTLMKQLENKEEGELEGAELELHRLALFKKMLSEIKLGNLDTAKKLAEKYQEDWDDTPFTYYSKAAFAYQEKDEKAANQWILSAARVFGGIDVVSNWQDTLIEFGYIKSFYGGGEDGEIEVDE